MQEELQELLVEQLKDAYSAEKQALRCMQRTLNKTTSPKLKDAIEAHIEETMGQIERVEEALQTLDAKPGRKVCLAMRGLVEEAVEEMGEHKKGPVLDLVIVASMQRIEHYEIAAYGTSASLAKALGSSKAAKLLEETLSEEKAADSKLTEVTQAHVMPMAMGGGKEQRSTARR